MPSASSRALLGASVVVDPGNFRHTSRLDGGRRY
jgi:hypothetical protein